MPYTPETKNHAFLAGQSNMERRMNQIVNSDQEIADSIGFTNIRFYQLTHNTADTEQDDILGGWDAWEDPTNQDKLAQFSAVCFLYAREISERIGSKVQD